MERVAIVGCSGGGKSTFARALGARLELPVVHLDTLFWRPGWVESDLLEFRARTRQALAGGGWISDGNFTSVADLCFALADTIIWLEQPRLVCLRRAVTRALTSFGRTRADLAPDCPEKIDLAFYRYIWTWERLARPRLQTAIEAFGPDARLIRLRGDRQVARYLSSIGPLPTPGVDGD